MSIRHWPHPERPREKLLERGAHALSDAELLALLLGSGTRGRTAVELGRMLIAFEELFRGTIDRAGVHPREVMRQTLLHNAAAVIFAHNHPSGVLEPSQADELITRRLKEALALMDVRVLDHFIIGDGLCFSFSEHGLL